MSQNCLGSYILGNPLGSAALGDLVRALPFEGTPVIRLVQSLPASFAKHPDAAALLQRNARQWMSVRDLHTLSLVALEQDGDAPFLVYEYQQGRLLSDILARCHQEGLPLSADQAVYIAERLAGALLSVSASGTAYGCLTAQSVLVTFEGEVKLLPGAFRDLHTTSLSADPSLQDYRRGLPPGLGADKATRLSADRYALGALMFELLSREPFRTSDGAFDAAARISAARAGECGLEPVPEALTAILQRACVLESSEAYEDLAAMKADLDQLIASGEYSPTTFNIAFLMHTLFRGEDEADTAADQSFLSVDRESFKPAPPPPPPPAPVVEASRPAPKPAPPREEPAPTFGMLEEEPPPSRKGLIIGLAAAAGIVAIVVLSYFAFFREKGPSQAEIAAKEQLAKMLKDQQEMTVRMKALEDERASLASQVANAKTTEEKQKAQKALEDTQKKLQAQKEEQKRLADQTAAAAAAAPAPTEKAPAPAPAQVAEKAPPPATPPAPGTTPSAAPATQPSPEKSAPAPSSPAPAQPPAPSGAPASEAAVKPGDFVEMWGLDVKPKQISDLRVSPPSAAVSQHLTGTVYVEVQIDETGKVTAAKVVKGLGSDFGLNAACEEAAMRLKFSPGISKGVPVKTKMTFPILFK